MLVLVFSKTRFLRSCTRKEDGQRVAGLLRVGPAATQLVLPSNDAGGMSIDRLGIKSRLRILGNSRMPVSNIVLSKSASVSRSSVGKRDVPGRGCGKSTIFKDAVGKANDFAVGIAGRGRSAMFSGVLRLIGRGRSGRAGTTDVVRGFRPGCIAIILVTVPLFVLLTPFLLS